MSIYEVNETMELLGNQRMLSLEENEKIVDVVAAYLTTRTDIITSKDAIFSIATDIFNLGKVYGVRTEREKRRNKA